MSNEPKVHLIGNAHLDPIWLWRWQEGCGEVLQTFRSALDRLNEYPDFVFTCSSASYYKWVEEIDPDMFAEIRATLGARQRLVGSAGLQYALGRELCPSGALFSALLQRKIRQDM